MWFNYSKAVVRGISNNFADGALKLEEPNEPIDTEKAKQQWRNYAMALENLGLEIIEIESDNDFPDCVFIEDTAVVCDGIALITRPGHNSRRKETIAVRKTIEKIGLKIIDMIEPGLMDGGDVLFTGREFFVGLSSRTNKAGFETIAKAFPDYPVTSVDMGKHGSALHLKSCMSMAGPDMIAIGQSQFAQDCWKVIEDMGKFKYQKLSLPEDKAANVLYINGTLVRQSVTCIRNSVNVFRKINCRQMEVDMSELAKADGCLSCCSLLMK